MLLSAPLLLTALTLGLALLAALAWRLRHWRRRAAQADAGSQLLRLMLHTEREDRQAEMRGLCHALRNDLGQLLAAAQLDVRRTVTASGDRGLLAVAREALAGGVEEVRALGRWAEGAAEGRVSLAAELRRLARAMPGVALELLETGRADPLERDTCTVLRAAIAEVLMRSARNGDQTAFACYIKHRADGAHITLRHGAHHMTNDMDRDGLPSLLACHCALVGYALEHHCGSATMTWTLRPLRT
ncbi:MAG: hypothetical protein KIT10_05270 [Flavobacteriales bacterium]|nr:hypothetical protein [Flavobacteriales bacterium]